MIKKRYIIALSYVLLTGIFSTWHVSRANSLEQDSYTQGFEKVNKKDLKKARKSDTMKVIKKDMMRLYKKSKKLTVKGYTTNSM